VRLEWKDGISRPGGGPLEPEDAARSRTESGQVTDCHLAFGRGAHRGPGSPLARLELGIAM
jgi:cytochrome P450